ncbi:hypothetical protein SIN8267_03325 [Sinobacterium norvegicum]|uniref:Uncharacterized protein n=2 Tax=Sinobacterium norvegicum TaxID=1641715 RepID=A0ABN8EM53_9GAMM|nr:hypothetical protein SIN8267_03325 [Sinobacterium norvegicum]
MNKSILGVGICFIIFSAPASAYLDPGTGSMVIQVLIAGILSALFAIKTYWYSLKRAVKRFFGREQVVSKPEEVDIN